MGRDLSRKEFLSRTALLAAGAVLPRSAGATGSAAPGASQAKGSGVEADLIVINARVFTSDPAQPRAEAFAVKAGDFVCARFQELGSVSMRFIE